MKTLSPKLTLAAAVLTLGLIQAQAVRADSPPPPPIISLYQMNAYGTDLVVTVWADPTTGDLPGTAHVRVTDTNGDLVSKVPFTPVSGEQTVWIPGALSPRPGDLAGSPIERDLDVYGGEYREIYDSTGIVVSSGPGNTVTRRRQRVLATKYCYLHLIKIICYTTESSGDDHAYLKINLAEYWRRWMGEDDSYEFGTWILMGENQGDFKIELWDDDSPDSDDHLGTHFIKREETVVERSIDFTEDDAHYKLFYEVRCFDEPLPGL